MSIFPLLQPVAELPRNQRDEIGHQHVKAHHAVASVCVWSHLSHPNQWQLTSGLRKIDHETGAFSTCTFPTECTIEQFHRFLYIPFQLMCKDEEDKNSNKHHCQWCDYLNWEWVLITLAWSYQWLVVHLGFVLTASCSADLLTGGQWVMIRYFVEIPFHDQGAKKVSFTACHLGKL